MNYLENFFSLDKFQYPATISLLGGILSLVLFYVLKISFDEIVSYIFIVTGFLIGNHIKVIQIQKELDRNKKNNKKIK